MNFTTDPQVQSYEYLPELIMSRSCLNYFFITILLTEFFATTTHYKVLSNLSKQVYNVSELNLKSMYD